MEQRSGVDLTDVVSIFFPLFTTISGHLYIPAPALVLVVVVAVERG